MIFIDTQFLYIVIKEHFMSNLNNSNKQTLLWYYYPILILNIIASIACAILNTYIVINNQTPFFTSFSSILYIIAFCVSIIYIIKGATKSNASFFKLFVFTCAIAEVFTCIAQIDTIAKGDSLPIPVAILSGIVALLYLVIAFSKNLGKRTSFVILAIAFVIRTLELISGIILAQDSIVPYNIVIYRNVSSLIIASLLGICIYAKYQDKKLRKENKI